MLCRHLLLVLFVVSDSEAGLQYEGKTFTVAFFPNYVSMYGRSVSGHLFFTSQSAGSCSVLDDDGKLHQVTLNTTSNAVTQFDLPGGKFYSLGEYVQKRGIYINCSVPVSMYGLSTRDIDVGAVSAFYMLPIPSLGAFTEYIIPSVPNNALLGVVAIQDNTSVTVDIKSNCPFLHSRGGDSNAMNLNFRDVYQIASEISGKENNCNLGGTRIRSSKPVALYSGASILTYPGQHGDQVLNQVRPVPMWGTEYIVPMVTNMDKYSIRVVGACNNTFVTRYAGDTRVIALNESQVYQEDFSTGQNVLLTSTKSVLVSQIAGNDQGYDAFASLIPALTEYSTEYVVPDMQAAGRHFNRYLTLITNSVCVPDIEVKANWTAFSAHTHDISVALFPDESLRQIKSSNPRCKFAVQVSGFAQYEAYAYFATPKQ